MPKGSKAALWNLAFYTGVRRGDVRRPYEFARVQLTRFRPVASSQTPYPSFCLSGQKLSHSVAPPFPTKPTSLGFGGAPVGGPLNPRGNVLGHSDVLCAYHLATVRVTRLSRAWRALHCFHALCVLRLN